MGIPAEVDTKLRGSLDACLAEVQRLRLPGPADWVAAQLWDPSHLARFEALRTRAIDLVTFLGRVDPDFVVHRQRIDRVTYSQDGLYQIEGILQGLRQDYDEGIFTDIAAAVEVEVVADYLMMGEQLFAGESGSHRHIPAAVLAGAVLEDGLRRLCQRQAPPISTVRGNGEPKTLNPMIDDLKGAGLYNELKAKQLRAWADIRNAAAHGHFDEFDAQDVEAMLQGVRDFLGSYL